MSHPSILMIGGGVQQVRAVEVAQHLGFRVVVTDRNPDAACFEVADDWRVIDGRDIESLIGFVLLEKDRLNIRGVFTLTELVTSVAAVSQAAELPGVSTAAAVGCQNKVLCKRIWQAAGIPTPRGRPVSRWEDAEGMLERLGGRAFVKPAVGSGGRGARVIDSVDELRVLWSGVDRHPSDGPMIVEELMQGSMHDVNGLIDHSGRFRGLGITDRRFLWPHAVEWEIRCPTVLSLREQMELYNLVERGCRATGIKFGPVKADSVLTEGGFHLLEVAPRLHGPRSSLFVLPLCGVEPLAPTLHVLAGGLGWEDRLETRVRRYSIGRALMPHSGPVIGLDSLKTAAQVAGIEHLMLFISEGDTIEGYEDSSQVAGYAFASGDSFEACDSALKRLDVAARYRGSLRDGEEVEFEERTSGGQSRILVSEARRDRAEPQE